MQIFVTAILLVFAGIALSAFMAGGAEKRKAALLWSISGAALSLLAGGFAFFQKNALKELAFKRLDLPQELPAALNLNINIPNTLMAAVGLMAFLSGVILFLWIFNCRKNSSKWYFAALWSAGLACFTGHILFMPATYGISTVLVLAGLDTESDKEVVLIWFSWQGVTLLTALIWSWHTLKTARHSWKNILIFAGSFTVLSSILWLSAWGCGTWAKNAMTEKAEAYNITPFTVENDPPERQPLSDMNFYTRHAKYNPPRSGRYDWSKETIPADEKEYTMKFFTSPELEAHLENLKKSCSLIARKDILYLSALQDFRSLVRHRADIAELYMRTGQKDKAMAEFLKYPELETLVPADTPHLICELVRTAARHIWSEALYYCGPEEKIYLPHYRKLLKWSESWRVHLPCEAGFHLNPPAPKLGKIAKFFFSPYANALQYRRFSDAVNMIPELEKLEQQEVIAGNSMYANAAKRQKMGIIKGRIALALKLYKVEHGRLPQKLSELVPEYLPKEYVSPSDGKKFTTPEELFK